ncbi:MAG: hypothetical protein RLP44_29730 [Aggregatilineales bacterium]
MPLADELTTVQTKITARASDIDDLLALGQSSATTALLNDIKATLNALQSDHTDILNEVNTFPAKINAKLGFDAQLGQAKIEQNYQILDALDACENPVDFYTALACALFGGVDWLLENPTFTQALRNFLIAQIQAGVGTEFDATGISNERLIAFYDLIESCGSTDIHDCLEALIQGLVHATFDGTDVTAIRLLFIHEALQSCIASSTEPSLILACIVQESVTYPELNTSLKQRIIVEVNSIMMPAWLYTGYFLEPDSQGNPRPLTVNNGTADVPWTDASITALMLYNNVPFEYDRIGVSNCAIARSRANFETYFPFGSATLSDCNISSPSVPLGVGSSITYSFLRHVGANAQECTQSTGSATFISEMIFGGGKLPMTSTDATNDPCPANIDTDWLICKTNPSSSNFEATYSWRDHFGLLEYFTNETSNAVLTANSNPPIPVGAPPGGITGLQNFMTLFSGGDNGKWRENLAQDGQNYLYSLFQSGTLSNLETGDYVFLYLGATRSSHGFMIVGWGDAVEADLGLNAGRTTTQSISNVRPRDPNTQAPLNSIPYIADFAYGYSDGDVGWLQDPRPRSFYASLAELSASQLSTISQQLGYTNSQDYLNRFQSNTYRRFVADASFANGVPNGWLFFSLPSILRKPFEVLVPSPVGGICS